MNFWGFRELDSKQKNRKKGKIRPKIAKKKKKVVSRSRQGLMVTV